MPTALIAGASGLVGRHLLDLLLAAPEYDRVVSLGRRKLEVAHPKLEQLVVDFAALDQALAGVRCDDVYCCLGTTIRQAGSRENFRAVDHAAVLALGWAAQRQGARRLFLVSALGADLHSRVFYNRVKGEMQAAVSAIGYESVVIAQPSLLMGDRAALGQPVRSGEVWATRLFTPVMWMVPKGVRPIQASAVASAMLAALLAAKPGLRFLSSAQMQARPR